MRFQGMAKLAVCSAMVAGCMALVRPLTAADEPRRIEIATKRFAYEPADITLKKGEPVVLVFHSQDVAHGIKFKTLKLQTEIDKGGKGELSFTPTETGDFVGHCSHFCGIGHGSMTLTLHVTE